MSLWRKARYGAAGVYRSVRYDLAKRSGPRHETTEVIYPEYDAYEPDDRSRRAATATGLGLVLAAAVVGVYFAVAGGMGVLLAYGSPGSPATSPSRSGSATPDASRSPSPSPPASSPSPPSPAVSVTPSHRPGTRTTPSRRPTSRPASTAPAPPPTTAASPSSNSTSSSTTPNVTGSISAATDQTHAEQP